MPDAMSSPAEGTVSVPLTATALGPAEGLQADERRHERTLLRLFDDYHRPVTRYVISLGLGATEAEDVVQEVFLALVLHLRRQRPETNLAGWLFQVARNLAMRHHRRRWWTQWLHPFETRQHDRIDPADDPETLLTGAEDRARWQRVLAALPDRDRQCLVLRAEGLTYRDIAVALNVSPTSVARSMARAFARFERLEERS